MVDEHFYTVETPEQIELVYDVAGIGSRIIAALIDHIVMLLILSLGYVVLTAVVEQLLDSLDPELVGGIFFILIYLFMCFYYIFFETIWNGQSPGKRLIGIRMVRVGGRPLGFLGSAIRNFIRLADFLPALYGVGVASMFIDRQSRRLGDIAAGALAVRERKAVTLDMLTAAPVVATPLVATASEQRIPNLRALRDEDFAMVETYARRRAQVAPDIRTRMDTLIVEGLEQRLGYPIQREPYNIEQFLMRVVAERPLLEHNGVASPDVGIPFSTGETTPAPAASAPADGAPLPDGPAFAPSSPAGGPAFRESPTDGSSSTSTGSSSSDRFLSSGSDS